MKHLAPALIALAAILLVTLRRRRQGGSKRRPSLALIAGLRNETALIAAREVRERLRGRLFRVVTLLLLLGVAAGIAIPAETSSGKSTTRVGVVGAIRPLERAAILRSGAAAGTAVVVVPESSVAEAQHGLRSGRVAVVVLGTRRILTKSAITSGDNSTTARLAHSVATSLAQVRALEAAGVSPAGIVRLAQVRPLQISPLQAARSTGTGRTTSTVGIILLFILLTQYNTWTLTGVMEEKSSRVVEVLLAAVRPVRLLAGKVLGIGLLVFAQAGLVVGVALAVARATGSDLLDGAGPATVASILVWLVLGYAFYSWVYAAAGSMAERQDQVQTIALPLAAPMVLGYVVALTTAGSGNPSTFAHVLAYLPPTAPFLMPVLVGLGAVSWWEVLVAAILSVAGTVAVARLAAVVYRRAVLRTGRRVKFREVVGRAAHG